ncbi:MAG: molybdopterin-synthase adenylyltransferase MoeB [Gammaproteobacteria bacterium]|nr:molybdopterin-synthase adenylyltransferase MoeB [Gammaproteobacteria bacterium]
MNDQQLLRYNRQIMLPQIGYEGQLKLLAAHVLIIGLGGLGSPVAMYLAAAGIGRLTLVDFDTVDLSNLQRQILHRTENIKQAKVASARHNLLQLNPEIIINTVNDKLDQNALNSLIATANVVVDASDNFDTRFAINRGCVQHRVPLVSGAAIRFEGQVSVFDLRDASCPCYRCLYDESGTTEETCSTNGVISPMVGIIGSIQALETIKLIAGTGETLAVKLFLCDGLYQAWRTMRLRKDPHCPVCGST